MMHYDGRPAMNLAPAEHTRPCMVDDHKNADLCDPANCPAHGCFAWTSWNGRQKRPRRTPIERALEMELEPDDPLRKPPYPGCKHSGCASSYRGVCRSGAKWKAVVAAPGGKALYLGTFDDEADAARAVNAMYRKLGRPAFMLNDVEEVTND